MPAVGRPAPCARLGASCSPLGARSKRAWGSLAALCLALALGPAGCRSGAAAPPVLGTLPAFQLTDHAGAPFANASVAGHPWLASFLFTRCPGPCPRLVARLKELRSRIPAARLGFVSFSVDPANDGPPVLAAYRSRHGIRDEDAWRFVTGPEDKVLDLVRHGFFTAVEPNPDNSGDQGAVTHGLKVMLVDGEGRLRGVYSTDRDEELARLERELSALE